MQVSHSDIFPYRSKTNCQIINSKPLTFSTKHKRPLQAGFLWRRFSINLIWNSKQVCGKKPDKWSRNEPIKVSWVIQIPHKTFPHLSPHKGRLTHSSLNCIWIQRKNIKTKTLKNISHKTKTQAKTTCLCSFLLSLFPLKSQQHTWKTSLWIHQSLKDYLTHLSLHLQPTLSGCGKVLSGRYRGNVDFLFLLNYNSCTIFFCMSA